MCLIILQVPLNFMANKIKNFEISEGNFLLSFNGTIYIWQIYSRSNSLANKIKILKCQFSF